MRPWCGRQPRGSETVGHRLRLGCQFGACLGSGAFGAALLFGEGEKSRGVRAGQGGWDSRLVLARLEGRNGTGWALVGRTTPSLKLGAALCMKGNDYEDAARGCARCKVTPWKWSCKVQMNDQQVPVRDKPGSPSPKHQIRSVPTSC